MTAFKEQQKKIISEHLTRKQVANEIAEYRKTYWKDRLNNDSDNRPEDPEQAGWEEWKEN